VGGGETVVTATAPGRIGIVLRRVVGIALALSLAACGGSTPSAAPGSGAPATAMPAGTYTSKAFQPATTFTVPAGWVLARDEPTYLELHPVITDTVGQAPAPPGPLLPPTPFFQKGERDDVGSALVLQPPPVEAGDLRSHSTEPNARSHVPRSVEDFDLGPPVCDSSLVGY
jgi:hypothetical protein